MLDDAKTNASHVSTPLRLRRIDQMVVQFLSEHPGSKRKEILRAIGCQETILRRCLPRLRRAGAILQRGNRATATYCVSHEDARSPFEPKALSIDPDHLPALASWVVSSRATPSDALRARIVLLAAEGRSNAEIAEQLDVLPVTVGKWIARYRQGGLRALRDLPRSGQPRKLFHEKVEEITRLTTSSIPPDATHWSLRLMARHTGVTVHQVRQVWSEMRLAGRSSALSMLDPELVDSVRDVAGLHLQATGSALVLAVSEERRSSDARFRAWVQHDALSELPPPSHPRHGHGSLYVALDAITTRGELFAGSREGSRDLFAFLGRVLSEIPEGLMAHILVDHPGTYDALVAKGFLSVHSRARLHAAPAATVFVDSTERLLSWLERKKRPNALALRRCLMDSPEGMDNARFHFPPWIASGLVPLARAASAGWDTL